MAKHNFCFKLWWCFDNTEKARFFDLLLERLSPTSTVGVQIDKISERPKKAGKRCSKYFHMYFAPCLPRNDIKLY